MIASKWQADQSISGIGLGFRACHYQTILSQRPAIPWFEVTTENYFSAGGHALKQLSELREMYPIVFHGVSMSLGSVDPINQSYLQQLKKLIQRFKPAYISDHLCWSSFSGQYFHDLLPLPYTEQIAQHVANRILHVQEFLGQQILVENVSSYVNYTASTMEEWDFLNLVAEKADCYILLDINNIYVSSFNHGFSPAEFLNKINSKRIKQFHLAGYQDCSTYLLDNHGAAISPAVWDLYAMAVKKMGQIPTVIEWDNTIPDFNRLLQESEKAAKISQCKN